MKVNFENIECRPSIAGPVVKDNFTKTIAEAVYQQAMTCAQASFAMDLYKSEGDIEITDEQKGYILSAIHTMRWWAQEPIRKRLGEK